MMENNRDSTLSEPVDQWINKINASSSLTVSDSEELKSHILDTIDELKSSGLDDAAAFEVASMRIGKNFDFEEEYAQANSDTLLTRKIILIFSGIMFYFLLYFSMMVSYKLIFLNFHDIIKPAKMRWDIIYYLIGYHLIVGTLTILISVKRKKIFRKIETLKIRPIHITILIFSIFSLAFYDFQLVQIIKDEVPRNYLTDAHYYWTMAYSSYSFPFVMAVCLLIIIWKKNLLAGKASILKEKNGNEENIRNDLKPINTILIALSGILVYVFLYYLLNATIKIFLTVLQQIENDPVKNFGWTKWYIASFHLILIFFTISIYIKDGNLMNELKKLSIRSFQIAILFFTTVFLAIIDYLFLPISRLSLHNIIELKLEFNRIMQFSDLSFSFVLLLCFLVLFNKYYRENMKIY